MSSANFSSAQNVTAYIYFCVQTFHITIHNCIEFLSKIKTRIRVKVRCEDTCHTVKFNLFTKQMFVSKKRHKGFLSFQHVVNNFFAKNIKENFKNAILKKQIFAQRQRKIIFFVKIKTLEGHQWKQYLRMVIARINIRCLLCLFCVLKEIIILLAKTRWAYGVTRDITTTTGIVVGWSWSKKFSHNK